MRRPATVSIALATLLLALGYALDGRWIGAAASVALGCLWLVGLRRNWNGTDPLGLVGFTAWLRLVCG